MKTFGRDRYDLALLPTPLHPLPRLTATLGGPEIWVKRDDQTGLATGGNKARKLEFVVADALASGADTLITAAAVQSNHCRQTAAAAAKAGLHCILMLAGSPPVGAPQGNLLLDQLLGAQVIFVDPASFAGSLALQMESIADRIRQSGGKPYVVAVGASTPLGCLGYVNAAHELQAQIEQLNLPPFDRIVVATGSTGTQAGLLVGMKAMGIKTRVEGIAVVPKERCAPRLKALVLELVDFLGLSVDIPDDDIVLHGEYGDPGYAVITPLEREAIRIAARSEGLLLDPVYTGRALGGLIRGIRSGMYAANERILFWHTGGIAGLFPRADEVLAPDSSEDS